MPTPSARPAAEKGSTPRDLVAVRLRRFDVDDYHRLGEAGVLGPEARVELLDGEVVDMAPIGSRHAACVVRLTGLLSRGAAGRMLVSVQNPVRLGRVSEPQPDVALLRPGDYSSRLPSGRDVFLVVEVCDSSLEFDRGIKVPLYARARVPEVWLVDLAGEEIEVLRRPSRGLYREAVRAGRTETISPAAFPDLALGAADILGPRPRPAGRSRRA